MGPIAGTDPTATLGRPTTKGFDPNGFAYDQFQPVGLSKPFFVPSQSVSFR